MIDPADAPRCDWRSLNDETQVACREGHVVGVVYASKARTDRDEWWEFWWLPAGDVSREEVLFGLSRGVEEWDARCEAAQRAAQWIEAEWSEAQRPEM
jgi:hypothetical protein